MILHASPVVALDNRIVSIFYGGALSIERTMMDHRQK
jgi:hypothetical protein